MDESEIGRIGRNAQQRVLAEHTAEHRAQEFERYVERAAIRNAVRSEEHTSELQSRQYLVCRLLLEKKNRQSHRNEASPSSQLHTNDACLGQTGGKGDK